VWAVLTHGHFSFLLLLELATRETERTAVQMRLYAKLGGEEQGAALPRVVGLFGTLPTGASTGLRRVLPCWEEGTITVAIPRS